MGKRCRVSMFMVGIVFFLLMPITAQAGGDVDQNLLLELKQLIEQQQKQLNQQAAEIAKLKEQLGSVDEKVTAQEAAMPAVAQEAAKEEIKKSGMGKMVTSKFEHVDVSIYGHLNRGGLWADNGQSSKVTFVDNGNSQSRIGINGSVSPSEDFSVGTKIEYGIKSNSTSDVSSIDTNDATSVNWNLRHADIFFSSKSKGKISIGHGSAASDGTSEVDLSGTSVVTYSDVEALAGGQFLFDSATDELTEVRVKSVFNNMDGLGRDDRLRYDSPSFAGFTVSTSAVSGDAYDAAARYSRQYDDTKVAAAVAWASPGDANSAVSDQFSGSISILLGNGLNATFAAGSQDLKEDGRDDASNWYGKLGYRLDACSLGKTSFSVDYGQHEDIYRNGDEATTWSFAVVQDIPSWGTELYLAYRSYSVDSEEESLDDVNAVLGGARVKF